MISVSTMSRTEAQWAHFALDRQLPPEMGYEIYLGGRRFAGRETRPSAAMADAPVPPPAEFRGNR